ILMTTNTPRNPSNGGDITRDGQRRPACPRASPRGPTYDFLPPRRYRAPHGAGAPDRRLRAEQVAAAAATHRRGHSLSHGSAWAYARGHDSHPRHGEPGQRSPTRQEEPEHDNGSTAAYTLRRAGRYSLAVAERKAASAYCGKASCMRAVIATMRSPSSPGYVT